MLLTRKEWTRIGVFVVVSLVLKVVVGYILQRLEPFCVAHTKPMNDARPGHNEVGYLRITDPTRIYVRGYLPIAHSDPFFTRKGQYYVTVEHPGQAPIRVGTLQWNRHRYYEKDIRLPKPYTSYQRVCVYLHVPGVSKDECILVTSL